MSEDQLERARVSAEARSEVVGRPATDGSRTRAEALRRYLAAEREREERRSGAAR